VSHLFIFRRCIRLKGSLIFNYFSLVSHGFNPGGIHSVPQALVLVLISWGSSTPYGNLRVLELQDMPTCEMGLLFHHWEGLHDPLKSILKHLPLAELLLHVLLITELPELELIGLNVSHQGVVVSQ
jgi:hypothetical protein